MTTTRLAERPSDFKSIYSMVKGLQVVTAKISEFPSFLAMVFAGLVLRICGRLIVEAAGEGEWEIGYYLFAIGYYLLSEWPHGGFVLGGIPQHRASSAK